MEKEDKGWRNESGEKKISPWRRPYFTQFTRKIGATVIVVKGHAPPSKKLVGWALPWLVPELRLRQAAETARRIVSSSQLRSWHSRWLPTPAAPCSACSPSAASPSRGFRAAGSDPDAGKTLDYPPNPYKHATGFLSSVREKHASWRAFVIISWNFNQGANYKKNLKIILRCDNNLR